MGTSLKVVSVTLMANTYCRRPPTLTDLHDCSFEYLIIRFDYLIIPFDYLIIG